jgi:hypothetical protein
MEKSIGAAFWGVDDSLRNNAYRLLLWCVPFLWLSLGTQANGEPLHLESENEQWSLTHENGSKLTAAGIFRTRYMIEWAPEDEETDWVSPESIDFPTIEFKLNGSFFDAQIRPFLGLKGKDGDLELMELGMSWNVIRDQLSLKAGRYKIPFAREALTSAKDRTFVNRPLTQDAVPVHRDFGGSVKGNMTPIAFQTSDFGLRMPMTYESGFFMGIADTLTASQTLLPVDSWLEESPAGQEELPVPPRPYWAGRLTFEFLPVLPSLNDSFFDPREISLELGLSTKQDLAIAEELAVRAYGLDLQFRAGEMTLIAEALSQFNRAGSVNPALSFADTAHGASVEVRYLLWHRIEPAARLVDIIRSNESSLEKSTHTHQAVMGMAFFLVGEHLKWQADVGVEFDEWNLGETRFEAQTVLTAVF